jgi:hypothetical protein
VVQEWDLELGKQAFGTGEASQAPQACEEKQHFGLGSFSNLAIVSSRTAAAADGPVNASFLTLNQHTATKAPQLTLLVVQLSIQ